jgi:ketosteroid isomerase-like protein
MKLAARPRLSALFLALATACAASAYAQADDGAEVQKLMRDKQYTQALKVIDDALAKKPDDPKMRFRKGVVLSYLDKPNDALKVFEKLAQDHPDMPAPHNNIAVLLAAKGDYERARGALESAIRTNPSYATAYQNLGDVYARLASQAYNRALQLDKTDSTLPPKLALLRELTNDGPAGATTTLAAAPTDKPAPAAPTAAAPVAPPKPATPVPAAPAAVVAAAPTTPVAKPATPPAAPAAPAVVALAKPTPPAAAPAPATPPPAAANGAQAVAEVTKAVNAWAAAWSRRDMNGYFAAYAADHAGQSGSRKAWEEDRRVRIVNKPKISVKVSDLRVTVDGNKAEASFRQNYEAGTLVTNSRKTLSLAKEGGRWVIRRESSGG